MIGTENTMTFNLHKIGDPYKMDSLHKEAMEVKEADRDAVTVKYIIFIKISSLKNSWSGVSPGDLWIYLWNAKVYYCVHNIHTFASHINPVHGGK